MGYYNCFSISFFSNRLVQARVFKKPSFRCLQNVPTVSSTRERVLLIVHSLCNFLHPKKSRSVRTMAMSINGQKAIRCESILLCTIQQYYASNLLNRASRKREKRQHLHLCKYISSIKISHVVMLSSNVNVLCAR